jgi:hypothetical protein
MSSEAEVLPVELGRGIHVIDHVADVHGVGQVPYLQGSFDWLEKSGREATPLVRGDRPLSSQTWPSMFLGGTRVRDPRKGPSGRSTRGRCAGALPSGMGTPAVHARPRREHWESPGC